MQCGARARVPLRGGESPLATHRVREAQPLPRLRRGGEARRLGDTNRRRRAKVEGLQLGQLALLAQKLRERQEAGGKVRVGPAPHTVHTPQ